MEMQRMINGSSIPERSSTKKWFTATAVIFMGANAFYFCDLSFLRRRPVDHVTWNLDYSIDMNTEFHVDMESSDYMDKDLVGIDLLSQFEDAELKSPPNSHLSAPESWIVSKSENLRHGRRLEEEEATTILRDNYLGIVFPEPEKMPLHLRNTMEPPYPTDLVFFWHVPKAAGGLMKVVMGTCYGLRRAEKLSKEASMEMVKDTVLNVDTSTPGGIQEAQSLNIADSGMVDVIVSSYALSGSSLFTQSHRGRAFTLLRHPVDTAASLFVARKAFRPDLKKYTLTEYVNQDWYPDNWMVRQLTGTLPGVELNQYHLDRAKNFLSAKFFIGIVEQLEETMRQLRLFYGWKELPGKDGCAQRLVRGDNNAFTAKKRPKPKRGSDDWTMIANKEKWDLELYYFGLEMFSRQSRMFASIQDLPSQYTPENQPEAKQDPQDEVQPQPDNETLTQVA